MNKAIIEFNELWVVSIYSFICLILNTFWHNPILHADVTDCRKRRSVELINPRLRLHKSFILVLLYFKDRTELKGGINSTVLVCSLLTRIFITNGRILMFLRAELVNRTREQTTISCTTRSTNKCLKLENDQNLFTSILTYYQNQE